MRVGPTALAAAACLVLSVPGVALRAQGTGAVSEATFSALRFRNIGPATTGGRIDDFAVLETNPAVFYVATAAGGLWKTMNAGTTWEALFTDQDVVSIGDVAIPADDPNLVWVGSGENNNRQSSSWGGGIFKSTDGGHTWKNMGLAETKHIARIVIDPVDHDVVYVAALGHLWGPNRQRGIYKTSDGGLTWTNVLFVDENTGATELVMDPNNNKTLYAATYQRRRATWGMNGGGPGSAIWKSTDAGRSWTKLTNGVPPGPKGRIGLDIYRKNPNVLYARIEHPSESGTYRSDDAGATWRKMSDLNPRPMYFSQIRIDPNDDHRIYVLGVELYWSDDQGRTFTSTTVPHSDHHALWIDPSNSNHVITGCDGGVNVTWDRGGHWDFIDNLSIGQLYHVGYDMQEPYNVYGGLQDNSSWGGPSAVRNNYGIGNFDWFLIGSGDGFVSLADPSDPRTIYAESQGGNMNRVDRLSLEWKSIKPQPAAGDPPLRWNWDTPIVISPFNTSTIYVAANKVFKSPDRGHSWTAISPDLTAQIDREQLSLMGVQAKDFRIARNDGVSSYGVIVTLAESPKQAGVIYAGADDGSLQVTRDGGAHWEEVSARVPGLPKRTYVSRVAPSTHDAGTVYATFNNHREDDYAPYVYVSTDQGRTWRSITANLPAGQAVNTITEDPKNANVLYVGTEFGLFVSVDKGGHWTRLRANLPTVPIDEVTIQPRYNDMLLATHGRGVWILDDMTPLQQAAQAVAAGPYLFDAREAMTFNPSAFRTPFGGPGDRRFWGANPAFGAGLAWYLRQPARSVTLSIHDASGAAIREITVDSSELGAGIHRVYWDLRHQPLPQPETPASGGGGGNVLDGPFVLPGEYRVSLSVDGRGAGTKPVRVAADTVMKMSEADRVAWHATLLSLHQLQGIADKAADAVGALSRQAAALRDVVGGGSAPAALDALDRKLASLRRELDVPTPGAPGGRGGGFGGVQPVRRRLAGLKREIGASTSLPTETEMRGAREAREALAGVVTTVNGIIATDMPAVLRQMGSANPSPGLTALPAVPPLGPPPR